MEFKITEEEAREFAQLEASAGCDIGAGFDWGPNLGKFLASANSYIDHEKLVDLLRDRLGTVLSQEEIEEAACSFQAQLRDRVVEKYQSPKSAKHSADGVERMEFRTNGELANQVGRE